MNIKKMILGFVALVVLVVIGYGAYLGYSIYSFSHRISTSVPTVTQEVYPPPELNPPVKEENLNILVVGVDSGSFKYGTYRSGTGRTDSIMIFSINPDTRKVSLLSVPRDTYVEIAGRGMDKVNSAYAFGGINLSIKTLSQFLGIPINHYVKIDYESFVKIVDGLGGVTVDVTEDVVFFLDGKVKVHKGVQKMDGNKAFDYVQVREGDIGRVQRQQNFVKTLAAQALNITTVPKLPGILDSVASNIQTDMTPNEMLDLVMKARSMDAANILNEIVPGKAAMINGISYWIPDPAGTKDAVQRVFR